MYTVLDQSGDANLSEMTRFGRLYQFPDFVKKAQLKDVVSPEDKQTRYFADIRPPYQFPIHNKAATFISTVYFLEKQSQINPKVREKIAERLSSAADFWGIANAVRATKEKHASLYRDDPSPDSDYAIVWVDELGNKERHYPMRNSLEVKAAAMWFESNVDKIREQYSTNDRATVASKVLTKASEFGVAIGPQRAMLERFAGKGFCSPVKVANAIRDRIRAVPCDQDVRAEMTKLAEMVIGRPKIHLDPATMFKLAETIDQFDRAHGLLNKYSELIPAPEDFLFESSHTQAREFCKTACTLNTGAIFDQSDFQKLSDSDIRGVFGDDIADAVRTGLRVDPVKLAEVAETFPRPDAELFETLMASKGLQPVAKQSSTSVGFSHTDLRAMAETVGF